MSIYELLFVSLTGRSSGVTNGRDALKLIIVYAVVVILLLGFGAYLGKAAKDSQREAQKSEAVTARLSLPARCLPLYNVGRHEEWADCMGVGYVRKED